MRTHTDDYRDWLQTLKAGDLVIVEIDRRSYRAEVERRTATQILLTNGDRYNIRTGKRRGDTGRGWHLHYIMPAEPEDLAAIEHRELVKTLAHTPSGTWDKLDTAQLSAIIAIMEGEEAVGPGEIWKLGDKELYAIAEEVKLAMKLRADALRDVCTMADIRGQEAAKRALLIAIAGEHSILFIGGPDTGKTTLRAIAARRFGFHKTTERRPCPCGFRNDPRRTCDCKADTVEACYAEWPATDMWVEFPPVPGKILDGDKYRGTSSHYLACRLADAFPRVSDNPARDLTIDAGVLLTHTVNEVGVTAKERETILAVSSTIARIERSPSILTAHICEAANYVIRSKFFGG